MFKIVNVMSVFYDRLFTDKPHNPMVAGGAIMSAALIISLVRPDLKCMATKFEFIHEFIKV